MKYKKVVSFEDQKKIRFEILDEIDQLCREEGIRYSLAFGTLLGAVRHQGFIPWDDDLDIMMPLPDLLRLKQVFHSQKTEFCDIDTKPNYRCAFANVGHKATYRKNGLSSSLFGVGVDVLPFIGVPKDSGEQHAFFNAVEVLQGKRLDYLKWQSRFLNCLPIDNIPGFTKSIKKYRDYLFNQSVPYGEAEAYYVIALPLEKRNRCVFYRDLFDNIIDLPFEGKPFKCISQYDFFLTQIYGDYMQFPPIEEQAPHHGQIYYWR